MKSDKNIREGYKKTAVGVIPEEWEVKRLKEACKHFKSGYGITSRDIKKDDKYPVYGGNGLRGFTDSYTHEGDYFLIGRQGALCGNIQRIKGKVFISEHAIAVQTNKNNNLDFLAYKLEHFNLNRLSESSAQPGLAVNKLVRLRIPIPPLPEQQAIANCLTTWDSGIEKLTQLIAAKREQKKGLMQQLLTGKKRLDGFVGEWKEVKLDKLGKFTSGNGFPISEQGGTSGIPFYKVSDMNLKGNESIMSISNNYLSSSQIERLKLKPINKVSIIFAKVGAAIYLERKRVAKSFLIDNNMMAFTPFVFNDFIKFVFDTINLSRYVQMGALPSYNASDLKNIKIRVPSYREQTAIAHILTTADQEISLLEAKLAAMKEEKKGLMQVLLTGKKRLIDS